MIKIARNVALVALSATALTAISHTANAASITISGSALNVAPTPLYGSAVSSNNVVNSPGAPATGSILNDPTGPNLNVATTPWLMQGQVNVNCVSCSYVVSWFVAGAESSFVNTFTATSTTGPSVSFTEGNQNNSAYAGGPALVPGAYQSLGSTTGDTTSTHALQFSIAWPEDGGGTVDNNGIQAAPGSGVSNMIFSYLNVDRLFSSLDLTKTAGDWFAFALNDTGGPDDNHDDYVGFAHVQIIPGGEGTVPIPGALPLFGSVLGGGLLLRKLRKRRNAKASVPA